MKKLQFTKNKILKILIFIGIITICASLYIQYGQPYLKELSLQKLDQQRIKDLDSLNSILKDISSGPNAQFIGKNKVIYISLPSDDSTCSNLDLPSVPDGWAYHCSKQADYQKTTGTGWIPINVSGKINQLSLDPINNGGMLNYYVYVTGDGEYVITGVLNSKKYLCLQAIGRYLSLLEPLQFQ